MLWLGLHLPRLPLEIFTRGASATAPLAVAAGAGRERYVVAAGPRAQALGIQPGLAVSAAHVLVPSLIVRERDPLAEREALERLAAWLLQFTPAVSLVPPQALVLEVGASRRLFGGLRPLRERIDDGVCALGFDVQRALAPTPLAATWLARSGDGVSVTAAQDLRRALAPLPLALLDDAPAERLAAMGVHTLAQLMRLPRDGLARRFGARLTDALDRALGERPDPRPYFALPASYRGALALPAPVSETGALVFALNRLLQELAGFLMARGAGVTHLVLALRYPRRQPSEVTIELTQPTRDAAHLGVLFRERLARVALPEAVEEIELASRALCPLAAPDHDFFDDGRASPQAAAALIERLVARLGREAVQGVEAVADHRPEYAWRQVAPGKARAGEAAGERPLWLLPVPVPIEERAEAPWLEGPLTLRPDRERIEAGWWDGRDVMRDYFIAHNPQGACLWIYRELGGGRRWFLHGVFG